MKKHFKATEMKCNVIACNDAPEKRGSQEHDNGKGAWQKKKTGMQPDKPKRNRTFADC